ncbi:MAG: hypothetical protein JXR76_29215 [Deltaproteobacteria bacterium]|nr:hypothetical protein [Deltaproteobacteria bacterium]
MIFTIEKKIISGIILLMCLVALFMPFSEDPVMIQGTFIPEDNRENRLGSFSYEEMHHMEQSLIRQSQSDVPSERARAIGQLVTMYRKRSMIRENLIWLKMGLKEYPNDIHILSEEKKMQEIIKKNM